MPELFSPGAPSSRLDRSDRRLILALTLVYTLLTLLNLGTLSFPRSVYTAETDKAVTVDLGQERDVSAIWFNGNIAVGQMTISADHGGSCDYSQQFGEMFSWRKKTVDFHTRYVTMCKVSGDIALNEIAFTGPSGELLPAAVMDPSGSADALLDEQDTVPASASYFNGMYFDEIYHARTAYEILHGMSIYEWTHPPLGKELIALGVLIFGMTPFGWRVVPALFGAAMLPVMYILGKRFFRRRDLAFLAAALLALDTMHFAQTRIATVDVFIVFFILLMFLFMTDFLQCDFLRRPLKELWKPLGACGVCFGLGVASKWTGLYAGVGLAVLFFAHLILAGVEAGREKELMPEYRRKTVLTLLFCIVFFVLIPSVIYFLSYAPFFVYEASVRQGRLSLAEAFRVVVQQQESMYGYHSGLDATHLCQSAWYEWPFAERSVWFYYASGTDGRTVSNISSTGSPAVWWISAVGVLCLVTEASFDRLRSLDRGEKQSVFILLIAIAANLLPWTLVTRCTFQYHYFPTLPFVILGAVFLIRWLEDRDKLPKKIKWIWLGLAAVYFVLLLPAASGLPVPRIYAQFLEYVLPTGVLFHGAV